MLYTAGTATSSQVTESAVNIWMQRSPVTDLQLFFFCFGPDKQCQTRLGFRFWPKVNSRQVQPGVSAAADSRLTLSGWMCSHRPIIQPSSRSWNTTSLINTERHHKSYWLRYVFPCSWLTSLFSLLQVNTAASSLCRLRVAAMFRLSGHEMKRKPHDAFAQRFLPSHERCEFCNMECDTKYKRWEQRRTHRRCSIKWRMTQGGSRRISEPLTKTCLPALCLCPQWGLSALNVM